jgi:hypothetical protein
VSTPAPDQTAARHWTAKEWLDYYGECRDMLWGLGQKLSAIVVQASVFATATCGALIWLRRTGEVSGTLRLLLVASAGMAFLAFWWLAWRYFLQAKELGTLMRDVETDVFRLPEEHSALRILRSRASLFGHLSSPFVIHAYMAALGILVALVAWIPR